MSHTKSFFFFTFQETYFETLFYTNTKLSWQETIDWDIWVDFQTLLSKQYLFLFNANLKSTFLHATALFFAHFRAEVNVLWLICAFWICQASWIAKCRMKEGKGLVNTQQHLQQLYFATALNQLKAAELLTFACLDFKHIGCPKIYTYDLQMSEL